MSWNFLKMLLKPWQDVSLFKSKSASEPEANMSLEVCTICCGNCNFYDNEWTDAKGKRGFCDMIYWEYNMNFVRSEWYCSKFDLGNGLKDRYRVVPGSRKPSACIIAQLAAVGRGKVPGLRNSDVYNS